METKAENSACGHKTEVYSRVVGFYRPVAQFNPGMKEQFGKRKVYVIDSKKVEYYKIN